MDSYRGQIVPSQQQTGHTRNDSQVDKVSWEYCTVSITREPGYGFGIAVSGGRDNPHFANGDPSIAVSDVLKGGPAEDRLQVNDRIITVNNVSLENVEYATAVQVLRDSGNTVTLVVKRRLQQAANVPIPIHQRSHSATVMGGNYNIPNNALMPANSVQNFTHGQNIKVCLTKANKKVDYGIVLGCRLFVKEISPKARDQLSSEGYILQEGDIITQIHNTKCNDTMSIKEAKKIMDGCKERLNLVLQRDNFYHMHKSSSNLNNSPSTPLISSQPSCNLDDSLFAGTSYSAQNLYVQPPTRTALNEEKNNLSLHGRARGPLMDESGLAQLDRPTSPNDIRRSKTDEPPRPPPPRADDFYATRRQLYADGEFSARPRQTAEPRFISFQKEGSVGIRLTGGNEAGIFVTAVQPGSPASLQGLTTGDKILKVNEMDMCGVTREEAVLFLLSLQDRIDLIVQYSIEEYEETLSNQRGDSFHIKTHFHCNHPSKGEMAFRAGDIFHVIDTLHNGVVGSWQVLKICRGNQEMQRGVIPNKSRAEELATAQFNASKKEINSTESRGNFFRRRRSNHSRSKSLSRENWDDVVFSDSISKFPAYERVALRHPGFVRPVVLFGPTADLAREKLIKDSPDKFTLPLQDDDKINSKCRIIRLSNIRDIMDRGKHALLDVTPNAVDRLNYAQFYPIVIFLKTDSKSVIKQLRVGIPKSMHKSSKKLLEQCHKLDKIWSHIFSTTILLTDGESWYKKVKETIDRQQSGAVWMSESKPSESLSDDFLFPMTTSRLSYASSPESDFELSPGPSTSLSLGNLTQLVKSSSDPSIATNQDNLENNREIGEGMPPPYMNPYDTSPGNNVRSTNNMDSQFSFSNNKDQNAEKNESRQQNQQTYGMNAPDLPPRIDRASKPPGGNGVISPGKTRKIIDGSTNQDNSISRNSINSSDRMPNVVDLQQHKRVNAGSSLSNSTPKTHPNMNGQKGAYDIVGTYDAYCMNQLSAGSLRLGPNAPDDLKSVPTPPNGLPSTPAGGGGEPISNRTSIQEYSERIFYGGGNNLSRPVNVNRHPYDINSQKQIDMHNAQIDVKNIQQATNTLSLNHASMQGIGGSPRKLETKTDYGKYSRNNSVTQADYVKLPKNLKVNPSSSTHILNGSPSGTAFKPVPPPKPKNYRPPRQGQAYPGHLENELQMSPTSPNGFYYQSPSSHIHHNQPLPGSSYDNTQQYSGYGHYNTDQQENCPPNNYAASHHSRYAHRGHPSNNAMEERHALDLAGSREQRGSAFELYRKPQIGAYASHHDVRQPILRDDFYESKPMYYGYYQNASDYVSLQPQKIKSKGTSLLKSPLIALKKAFIKTTSPLRRMKSMVERVPKNKVGLRRQNSMMERNSFNDYRCTPSTRVVYEGCQEHYRSPAFVRNVPQNTQESYYFNPRFYESREPIYEISLQDQIDPNDLYANRALIDLEKRACHSERSRLIRRHSMADRMGLHPKRPTVYSAAHNYADEDIYQSKNGAFLLNECRRQDLRFRSSYSAGPAEPVYQSRREMHRNHLLQSRKEMQERIAQGKKEVERDLTPQRRTHAIDEYPEHIEIYMNAEEARSEHPTPVMIVPTSSTNAELHATESTTSNNENIQNYHTRQEDNLTDERKKTSGTLSSGENFSDSKESDMQKSDDTVVENLKGPDELELVQQEASGSVPSGRAQRPSLHISNVIKLTVPPPNVTASRTSIETHYTSQASLPRGPPNASSTPLASELSLPNQQSELISQSRGITTVKGIFDHTGGILCNNEWNVTLQIPPGAIPPGINQEIYFTVTDPRMSESVGGPPLDMENGETMLSPLVMCGPQGLEFLVPVTLSIPHCAGRTASLGLSLKATDSEKNLETNWDKIDLPSNTAAHTVSVKVDHF